MGYDPAGTARTYVLISIVITFLAVPVWTLIGLMLFQGVGLLLGAFAVLAAIMIYLTTYDRIRIGDYVGARGPCLVWGIIDLLVGFLVGGLFLLLAHSKLSDVVQGRIQTTPPAWQPAPSSTGWQPSYSGRASSIPPPQACQKICFGCGATIPLGGASCPRCGKAVS